MTDTITIEESASTSKVGRIKKVTSAITKHAKCVAIGAGVVIAATAGVLLLGPKFMEGKDDALSAFDDGSLESETTSETMV